MTTASTPPPEMEQGLLVLRKLYYGRRTAKDVVKALTRMAEDWDITAKVFVLFDDAKSNAANGSTEIVIRVACTADKADEIRGILALGHPQDGNYGQAIDPRDCLEFYQGRGLTRFRGT